MSRKLKLKSIIEEPSIDGLLPNTPPTWRWGRGIGVQLAKIERNLFTSLEEEASPYAIIYDDLKLRRNIKPVDFSALCFAFAKILSDQSVQYDNTDTNTGKERKIDEHLKRQTGGNFFGGTIEATLNELCEAGYGESQDSTLRKKFSGIIELLGKTRLEISIPIKNERGEQDRILVKDTLLFPIREAKRQSDGAKYYILYLHPVFCNLSNGWASFPQNTTQLLATTLKRKKRQRMAGHYHLLRLLFMQKEKTIIRTLDVLLDELGLAEEYEVQPKRTEKKLLELCEDIRDMGAITDFKPSKGRVGRRRDAVVKITFSVNTKFIEEQNKLSGKPGKRMKLPKELTSEEEQTDSPIFPRPES